jgi:hypothetical protein
VFAAGELDQIAADVALGPPSRVTPSTPKPADEVQEPEESEVPVTTTAAIVIPPPLRLVPPPPHLSSPSEGHLFTAYGLPTGQVLLIPAALKARLFDQLTDIPSALLDVGDIQDLPTGQVLFVPKPARAQLFDSPQDVPAALSAACAWGGAA